MIQSLLFTVVSLRSIAVVHSPLNNKNNNMTKKLQSEIDKAMV